MEISRDTNQMMSQSLNLTELIPEPFHTGEKHETAILVLNTKPFEAKPLIFDINGLI